MKHALIVDKKKRDCLQGELQSACFSWQGHRLTKNEPFVKARLLESGHPVRVNVDG
jgi:hypothetical protein